MGNKSCRGLKGNIRALCEALIKTGKLDSRYLGKTDDDRKVSGSLVADKRISREEMEEYLLAQPKLKTPWEGIGSLELPKAFRKKAATLVQECKDYCLVGFCSHYDWSIKMCVPDVIDDNMSVDTCIIYSLWQLARENVK